MSVRDPFDDVGREEWAEKVAADPVYRPERYGVPMDHPCGTDLRRESAHSWEGDTCQDCGQDRDECDPDEEATAS